MQYKTVLEEISAERGKQIAKGFNAQHDDEHSPGVIARGAAVYASHAAAFMGRQNIGLGFDDQISDLFYQDWPFDEGFNPGTDREAMIKAAAMLVAAIEQYDRRNGE